MSLISTSILNKPFRWWCNRKFEEVSENVRVGGKAAEVLSEAEAERRSENYRKAMRNLKRVKELAKRENPYLERKERYEKTLSDSGMFTRGSDGIRSRLDSVKENIKNERYEEAEKELNRIVEEMRRVRDSAVEDVFDLRKDGLSKFLKGNYEEAAERWREATEKFEVIAGFDASDIEFGSETDFERSPEEYVDEARVLTDLAELGAKKSSAIADEGRGIRSETRRMLRKLDQENALEPVNVSEWGGTDSGQFRDQVRRIRNEYRTLSEREGVGQEAGTTTVRSSSSISNHEVSEEQTSPETGSETEKSPQTPASEVEKTDRNPVRDDSQPGRDRGSLPEDKEQHETFEQSGPSSDSAPSGSKTCPECGKEMGKSVVFCTECGTNTEENKKEDDEDGEDDRKEGDALPEDGVVEPEREPSATGGGDRTESGSEVTEPHVEKDLPATDTADASHESPDATSDTHKKEEPETEADHNKSCPECGGFVDEDNSFCTSCGADLGKPSEDTGTACPECGDSVDEDDSFCTSCGADLRGFSEDTGTACPECGGSIDLDDSFCTSCGAELSSR